jgi:hypothetical protein
MLTMNGLQVGSTVEMLLAFALADRFNTLPRRRRLGGGRCSAGCWLLQSSEQAQHKAGCRRSRQPCQSAFLANEPRDHTMNGIIGMVNILRQAIDHPAEGTARQDQYRLRAPVRHYQ